MAKKRYDETTMALLATIAAAGEQGIYTSPVANAPLLADKLIEVNKGFPDEVGNIATRVTPKGIEVMNKAAKAAQSQTIGASDVGTVSAGDFGKPQFLIEDGIEMPAIVGRGRVGSSYPFDALQVGQSFKVLKPAKNLASTIASANKRYAVDIPGEMRLTRKGISVPATRQERKFVVRTVEGGSRIWRVDPSAE